MPKRKWDHEDANNNHVKASKDVPQPKKLQKKPAEKSSDQQKEKKDANNNHVKASKNAPQPKKLQKKPAEKSSDEQKEKKEEPLDPITESRLCQQRFVSAKQTENLSKLTYDLLVEIAKRLKKLEDFTCFRSVSKSLHLSVKEEYFEGLRFRQSVPYLMLPPPVSRDGNDDIRQFYSLVEGESIVASFPMFKSTMCFESLGWLLTVEVDGSMSLLDPFSDTEIPVPHQNTFPGYKWLGWDNRFLIKKMVLSSRPNETSDFILMIIVGDLSHLAFWRLGDEAWNKINDRKGCFRDVVYDGGEQFYAISSPGIIWVINLAGNDNHHVECRIIIDCEPVLRILGCSQNQYILKTIDGSLLGITRTKEKWYYLTNEFHVYEIDIETSTCKEIYSLGSMAVFLGRNSSIAVDASKFPTGGVIKANHIYFTDDFGEFQNNYFQGGNWRSYSRGSTEANAGSVDSGVYNFETGAIEPIYPVEPLLSNVCPAMWITPNLCF